MDVQSKRKTVEGQVPDLAFVHFYFLHGDIRDSQKYDSFREKQVVLFMNLLKKGLIQEIIQWKQRLLLMSSCSETLLTRELKKRRRRLKSEIALFQTLPRLFHLPQFVKCWQSFLELNSKECIEVQETSSTKRFNFTSQSCCFFANLNLLHFCRSH